MSTELMTMSGSWARTAIEIRAQVNLIQEVMQAVMKKDVHYGIIPGCKKPSLWKPGAEVLFATFRISVDPIVEDLSTNEEARFRVTARAGGGGMSLGSAVGEASSDEEKYKWRAVVCKEEWEATPEDRRRLKWRTGREKAYSIEQVRTEVADHRNTILKMAAKRAYVALALQVTAASDIFTQDIEDLPAELQDAAIEGDVAAPLPTEIKRKESPSPAASRDGSSSARGEDMPHQPGATPAVQGQPHTTRPTPAPRSVPAPPVKFAQPSPRTNGPVTPTNHKRVISEQQARRFYAIWKSHEKDPQAVKEYLQHTFGITDDRQIPADGYEKACAWAEGDF